MEVEVEVIGIEEMKAKRGLKSRPGPHPELRDVISQDLINRPYVLLVTRTYLHAFQTNFPLY